MQIRRLANVRRVGHTGTLDPMATGVLIICIGTTTRLSEYYLEHTKRYRATVRLGIETDTYDAEGTFVKQIAVHVSEADVRTALKSFLGLIEQRPPAFSAIKIKGERSYNHARRGEKVELPPRIVEIFSLEMSAFDGESFVLELHSSKGTYVRSLAHDLGSALNCGAHLSALERTASGPFTISQAHDIETVRAAFQANHSEEILLPPDAGLIDWPKVTFDAQDAERISHGNAIPMKAYDEAGMVCAYNADSELIAIVEADLIRKTFQPRKVLIQSA